MTKIENLSRDQLINRIYGLLAVNKNLEAQVASLSSDLQIQKDQKDQLSHLVQISLQRAA
jgi:hypothetical protein